MSFDDLGDAAWWLWSYLGGGYENLLDFSPESAERVMAFYAADRPMSPLGMWYRSLSEEDRVRFREYWVAFCLALVTSEEGRQ